MEAHCSVFIPLSSSFSFRAARSPRVAFQEKLFTRASGGALSKEKLVHHPLMSGTSFMPNLDQTIRSLDYRGLFSFFQFLKSVLC